LCDNLVLLVIIYCFLTIIIQITINSYRANFLTAYSSRLPFSLEVHHHHDDEWIQRRPSQKRIQPKRHDQRDPRRDPAYFVATQQSNARQTTADIGGNKGRIGQCWESTLLPLHVLTVSPLWNGRPHTNTASISSPLLSMNTRFPSVLEDHAGSIGHYGDPQGKYALRACLSDYLRHSRGVVCLPEQIVIGSGISYSMGILAKLFRDRRRIGFEEPGFAPVREQWIQNGFEVIPISVNDRGLSLAELNESGADIVYRG